MQVCHLISTQLLDGTYSHVCARCGRVERSSSARRVQQCRGQRSKGGRLAVRPQCAEFGAETGEVLACTSCGKGRKLKTFVCGVHKLCTPETAVGTTACCVGCADYRPRMFDKCYVVSLTRRDDRWQKFMQSATAQLWPFPAPERWPAVDGKLAQPPAWFKAGGGAWGCYRSHLQIMEHCLSEGINSVLILEDDAVPIFNLRDTWLKFQPCVPPDWGMVYLGGQLLRVRSHVPRPVNAYWSVPYNVNRTHAYALRGETMQIVYKYLTDTTNWKASQHIDHRLGALHQSGKIPLYICSSWMFGQAEARSDITGKAERQRFWASNGQAVVV